MLVAHGTQQPLNNLILCYRRASKIRQVCNVLVMDNYSNFFAETLSTEQNRTLRRRAIESRRSPCIVYRTYRFHCTQINVQCGQYSLAPVVRAPTSLCHQHASRRKIFPPENILNIQSVTRQAYLVAETVKSLAQFRFMFSPSVAASAVRKAFEMSHARRKYYYINHIQLGYVCVCVFEFVRSVHSPNRVHCERNLCDALKIPLYRLVHTRCKLGPQLLLLWVVHMMCVEYVMCAQQIVCYSAARGVCVMH